MQKISSISFKGIEQKQALKDNANVSSQIGKDLRGEALPICDKSLAISPSLPSEFLNETDIARYRKAQESWARMFAEETGIPYENVISRLPDIQIAQIDQLVSKTALGQFDHSKNVIEMNPIRELANLNGGDEARIAHESIHGLFHNLRRAYAKTITRKELDNEIYKIILTRIFVGENKPVFKHELTSKNRLKTMAPPLLTQPERKVLVKTIQSIDSFCLDTKTLQLNEKGINLVKEELLPQLQEYKKLISGTPDEVEERCLSKISDYINSFFIRWNIISRDLRSEENKDISSNITTHLTKEEEALAKQSIGGILETKEGTSSMLNDTLGILEVSSKSYFVSYEEKIARTFQSKYRLAQINKKINAIITQGLVPGENILLEKQAIENNLKLLELISSLQAIEAKIINAPKDIKKALHISSFGYETKEIIENFKTKELQKHIKELNLDYHGKTAKQKLELVRNNLTKEEAELFDFYLKLIAKMKKYGKLASPEKLLANTPENKLLKESYNELLNQIRELSMHCDLSGLPKVFFKTKKDFITHNRETSKTMKRCLQKLSKGIKSI